MSNKENKNTSQKRLQMQDIAKMANVSTSTVSRALNGSTLINDATKERVLALAKSLNYSIDIGAQNLRLKNNKTIAVIIPFDPTNPQAVSDPFFLTMLGYLADELTRLGHYMLVSRVNGSNANAIVEPYDSGRAMGIIVIGQSHNHQQLEEQVADKPIIVWGAKLPDQHYVSVGSNNVQGGFLATEHLIQQQCKRIAFFGDKTLPEVAERYEGYLLAHQQYGLSIDKQLCVPVPFSAETVKQDIDALNNQKISYDGLFACSDLIAIQSISYLQKLGISVPNDIAVIGYDDISIASYFNPSVSTIKQSIEEGAKALVSDLFKLINNEPVNSEQLSVSLIIRDSSLRTSP
jgi:DNA-binding LacI/PurR family transcriptional regulator